MNCTIWSFLDFQLILKIVVLPEDESSFLFKRCVVCFMRIDDGKRSNTY
jgi:hypothetical protein